jgi:ribonuclease E
MVEARAADDRVESVHVNAAPEVALYLLNEKRSSIANIEADCHVAVRIEADEDLKTGEFNIEGRAGGEPVSYKPVQPIDLRKLKPLPPPAPDEIEEEDDEIVDDGDEDEDDHEGHDHGDDEDGDEEASSDADDDEDEDRGQRGRRGRRGGRRRRGGRERGEREPSGLEIVEPSDETTPVAAREDGGRDEGRGRGGRRRRRGGRDRDRDRGERNRIPDIASDGGEMLDAIASAPFLVVVTPQEQESEQNAPPPEATPVETAAVFEAPVQSEPEPQEAAPVATKTMQVDHEIAASEPEAPSVEPVEQAASEIPAQAETRRHAIHGAPEESEPTSDKAPRKAGWWSRRKTG